MILKVIMAKLRIVLSLVLVRITGKSILFHAIMENGAIFYRLPITAFIQRGFKPLKMFLGVDLMSYSFGIVSVIILLYILGIS